jgi:serine/threonine protein phosphatase PrpC
MVREGLLTTKEAEVHPRRNVLQRSIGVGEMVDIDVLEPIELRAGDTFILCSDGLHGLVKEPELREVGALPVEDAVQEFVRRALDRGAPDNVTVVVARVEESNGTDEVRSESLVKTEPMKAMREEPAKSETTAPAQRSPEPAPAARHSFWRWFLGFILLAGIATAAAYLLGYRIDYGAAQRWFS